MRTRRVLVAAGLMVALAIAMWIGVASLTWSAWRSQQAALAPDPNDPITPLPVDRERSSVQYAATSPGALPATEIPAVLIKRLALPSDRHSVVEWAEILRESGVQVCLEEARTKPEDLRSAFAISLADATVQDVLDQCCGRDERYRWEWMQGTEIINVVPRKGLLEGTLGDVSFQGRGVHECLADLSPHLTCPPMNGARGYGNILFWPLDIEAQEISMRDYLNLIVQQYEGMTWTVNARGLVYLEAPEATRSAVRQRYRGKSLP